MKKIHVLFLLLTVSFSCNNILNKTIRGNGNISTEQRSVSSAENIKSFGNFDIELMPGTSASAKVSADQNLLPYILVVNKGGNLVIKTKDNVNLSSANKITVYITTDKLESIELAGSGNVKSNGAFSGGDHLNINIEGTGDVTLDVNTPSVSSSISGTGNVNLSGETKDSKIEIAGIGDYKASNLKSESVDVHIAGSGNASVFASASLQVQIAGSGDVSYRGTPAVTQHIAGSGTVKQLP